MIVANTSKTISFQKENDRKHYYKNVQPVFKIQIHDSSVNFSTLGKFPQEYAKSGVNFNDHMPSACFGDHHTVCLSFGAYHGLYKYQDTSLVLKKEVKSQYIYQFTPYPDDKTFDMLFLKKYFIEEPRYTNIIFDPWRNFYYRIVKLRSHFDQQTNKTIDNKWSVIITDENFNKLDEIVFDYSYSPKIFVPTKNGVLMFKNNASTEGNSVLKLFKIEKND